MSNPNQTNQIDTARELANEVASFISKLKNDGYIDQRWLSIATTDLQKAFMSLERSIERPNIF